MAGPVRPDDVFELGSITKAVTGLLLADAVVRGEVTLETTLDECLPGARPLRLADLASHVSGLPRLPWPMVRRGLRRRRDPYAATTLPEMLDDVAGVRLRRRRRPRYSNVGAALLGQAVAARAGGAYEDLVRERVLGPLGITGLWAGSPPVAQPHDRRGRPVPAWTMGAYAPAGCLRGTVRGALALSTACLNPPAPMAAAVRLALTPRTGGFSVQFGLGWISSPLRRGSRMWWHNGGTGGSRAFTGFDPQTGVAVAAVANARGSVDATAVRAFT